VPPEIRPPQEALDPDERPNDWADVSDADREAWRMRRKTQK